MLFALGKIPHVVLIFLFFYRPVKIPVGCWGSPSLAHIKQALFQTAGSREAAEVLQKQSEIFPLGNLDNSNCHLFPPKHHYTWRGTDALVQYLDFGAV